jgi:hypothetical protein
VDFINQFLDTIAYNLNQKKQTTVQQLFAFLFAETEGFEPSKQLPVYTLSKRAPSATRTNLLLKLYFGITANSNKIQYEITSIKTYSF